ncbi:hypothetical protein Pyn_17430 [Prunus yedoensis var. nudiflora]|uniref:Uncharacterized protein n=1 Tax=Prunus yedoensis var. nudiflora TaxID=2094558 RepID=A0A314Z6R4_PRUYE|nr:hypothetical protein Pyn_17430 [Prunus yedoensis var. nudiflora]
MDYHTRRRSVGVDKIKWVVVENNDREVEREREGGQKMIEGLKKKTEVNHGGDTRGERVKK